ncbi:MULTISPECIES: XRE family transcriptional regulator [unclassified Undibacterium]|uniref:helix-turn-helix domain-containing protein n=1 Tax=unclassified Undibacterium TaxID=2630295 RepID=UPI002AC9E472|nr:MULTISPECIES: XRE family transcriptional regulator [unclassified Undibacterium]MEB0137976.1 XRE family transcriptional regulator [Undibacterium sp. CCC2.1]MEB0170691.1 XRE family transcriptional regulator [Undibacterium sp. CCC1.1]MEB0177032.1 XRE family transcriptional regulator [Undibacterium sp. CCC3.4]MEB0216321.1 XRE family transcriptional regulator [Undibacterium sp. 5I2]WPX42505.1 XRE family transcriptional regulator [Undibacterium sp. CCC3.4]
MRKKIGARLKTERERLGYSQAEFAIVGDASKRSQIDWEQGKLVPNAEYLALISTIGVDVQFVLTGVVSNTTITPDENELLTAYRALGMKGQARLLGVAEGIAEAKPPKPENRKQTITFHGDVGQQITGDITGPQTINVGRKKNKQ